MTLTAQQTFDKVKAHLLKQGKRAENDEMDCLYLAPSGDRCAIGCLIPDGHEALHAQMNVGRLLEEYKDLPFADIDHALLGHLQCIHDNHEPSIWHTRLEEAARLFGLTP